MLQRVFSWLQGRSTAFFIAFFVSGTTLQVLHKLDMTYVAFMGTLLGAIVGHSVKEDWFNTPSQNGGDNASTK